MKGKTTTSRRSPQRTPSSIEVFIEELVLEGFSPGERSHIGDALELEMARLLTERGTPQSWAQGNDRAFLDCGRIDLEPGSKTNKIGTSLAEAVVGGLKK